MRSVRVLVLLLALVAVACSGDDATPEPTTTTVDLGPDTGDGVLSIGTTAASPAVDAAVALALREIGVADDQSLDVAVGRDGPDGVLRFSTTPVEQPSDLVASTVPTPPLHAQAVADVVAGDEVGSVAVIEGDDVLEAALEGAGVAATAVQTVDETTAAEPDAVVMVVDETSADLIPALQDAGYVTGENRLYLVTQMADPALGFVVGDRPGVLEGVTVIQPGAEVDEDLRARLIEIDPSLEQVTGAPEAYDAAVIAALASEAAGTDDPDFVAAEVPGVTRGGTTCTNFEECRRLIADGEDIAYAGLGGSYALDDDRLPTRSVFTVFEYGADNFLDGNRTEYVVAVLPG